MPISHETLLLAKKYTDQLHAGGGTHYTGGHGIIVEGESIKIDSDVTAEQSDIRELTQAIETTNGNVDKANNAIAQLNSALTQTNATLDATKQDLSITKQDLITTQQDLNNTKEDLADINQAIVDTQQNLSTFQTTTNQNMATLTAKDVDLQTQIDNLENGTTTIPVATAGKSGIVMPRQGLVIDRAGALNTTIQQYLDLTCGKVFLAPKESKTIKLYHPCYVVYLEFYLVDSVNVAGSNLLYMSNVNNATITKGYLTATFDTDKGTYIALTNNHSTNCMFVNYGCKDLRLVD